MRTLILENEYLRISILIDFGAKIFEFIHKSTDRDFMYHNPRVECRMPVYDVNADNWWTGGIDEAIPTGHKSVYKGEEYPYLGEVWSLPWNYEIVSREEDEVKVHLWRTTIIAPLKVEKWITLRRRERIVRFHHKITNLGHSRFEFIWGIHPGFSVNPNFTIDIPAEDVFIEESLPNNRLGKRGTIYKWPYAIDKYGNKVDMRKVQPEKAQTSDFHYAIKLTDGWFALTDTFAKEGFGFVFPKDIFKVIWLWLVYGGWRGLYCIAIEPWTGYPAKLDMAVREGIYSTLESGESLECDTFALIYKDISKVERITPTGEIIGSD
jgi:galactose mutarotase-like enzyme